MKRMNQEIKYSPISYSVEGLAEATGIGRSTIYEAIRAKELRTVRVQVAGRVLRRTLIDPQEAARWIQTFPDSREVA